MGDAYRTVTAEVTAADTKTAMTNEGSKGDISPILVPAGKSRLDVIIAGAPNNATLGQSHAFIRLEGSGLQDGPETLSVGGGGGPVVIGSLAAMMAREIGLGLAVIPGNEIEVYGEMGGTVDPGQWSVGVTLVFS